MRNASSTGKAGIIITAIVAIAIAALFIFKTATANQGKSMGDLGNLSGDRAAANRPSTDSTTGVGGGGGGKEAEQGGRDAASGAPPGMQGGGFTAGGSESGK